MPVISRSLWVAPPLILHNTPLGQLFSMRLFSLHPPLFLCTCVAANAVKIIYAIDFIFISLAVVISDIIIVIDITFRNVFLIFCMILFTRNNVAQISHIFFRKVWPIISGILKTKFNQELLLHWTSNLRIIKS